MLHQIVKNLNLDKDYPERCHNIDIYTRVLNGELYDGLKCEFCDEYDSAGAYIPLHRRKPSVRNNLCRTVVDETVSLLFGNDHFPKINTESEEVKERVDEINDCIKLRQVMLEAALIGSTGSVALFLRFIEGEPQVEVLGAQYLTPTFDPANPRRLISVEERYKVKGAELEKMGYVVESSRAEYWIMRQWDVNQERYYFPFRRNEEPKEDKKRRVEHNLGFVPIVWIKNLPKATGRGYKEIDGACTFKAAIDISIEIDYLLSQGGRGLKYSSDPLVVFRLADEYTMAANAVQVADGTNNTAPKIVRTGSNAFVLGKDDDAKLLEINGRAAEAIINHVRYLRELAMEGIHGNRSHADKIHSAQSGKAMQKLDQALLWLADMLRVSYGENGIIPLIKMIMEASRKIAVSVNGKIIPAIPDTKIELNWPHWYPPTPDELSSEANTLTLLKDAGLLSQKTAVETLSEDYNIVDVEQEIKDIKKDQDEFMKKNVQIKENVRA